MRLLRSIQRLIAALFFLFFFVLGIPIIAALTYYFSLQTIAPAEHASLSNDTFFAATITLLLNFPNLLFWPDQIPAADRAILTPYGNALILGMSLAAVLISSWVVRERLRTLSAIVPYDKYLPPVRHALTCLAWVSIIPRLGLWFRQFRDSQFRNYYVGVMYSYYRDADHLVIVSGDYSWLFDTNQSAAIRTLIEDFVTEKKAILLSYKSPNEVARSWSRYQESRSSRVLFQAIAFGAPTEIKASVIQTNNTLAYIHLFKETNRRFQSSAVCVFYGDREARELVRFTREELVFAFGRAQRNDANRLEKPAIIAAGEIFS